MRNKSQSILLAIIVLLCGASAATADIKVKTKTSVSGQSFEGTTYIKKARQRTEQNMAGMSMAIITQCDERRTIQLNDKARTYLIMPFGNDESTVAPQSRGMVVKPKSEPQRRGGVLTTVYNVSDTGERKQMFGMTARHLKITMTTESSPDACNPTMMKMEMDGWYVDLEYGLDCQWGRGGMAYSTRPDCVDEYRMKTVGAGKLGYPLVQTIITYGDDGREMSRMTTEVVELNQATLDAALFEIPAGYTEVKNVQELYTGAASSSTPTQSDKTDDYNYAASRASKPNAAATSATGSTPATVTVPGLTDASAPKKAGAIRIGLIMPKAQMSEGVSPSMAAEGVRNTFVGYLNGPSIEVVALNARMPAQAIEEARQSQCDYVLFSGITQKKGGGGMFGKIAGNIGGAVASNIPYGGSAGEAAARTAAATAIYTTATIASSVKAKDEVSLEYKLQTTDPAAKPIVETTGKAKAKSDGEDVITPLVERAAQTIVAGVKR